MYHLLCTVRDGRAELLAPIAYVKGTYHVLKCDKASDEEIDMIRIHSRELSKMDNKAKTEWFKINCPGLYNAGYRKIRDKDLHIVKKLEVGNKNVRESDSRK